MNKMSSYPLKVLKKTYSKIFKVKALESLKRENDPEKVSELIYKTLIKDNPCMIARCGANELSTIVNYMGVKKAEKNIIKYIKGEALPWWWNKNHITGNMLNVAGFFPPKIEKIEKFCEMMLEDMQEVDILASWLQDEKYVEEYFKNSEKVRLIFMDPFWAEIPWTKVLEGKNILVVHPFSELIEEQYKINRENLFSNKMILPKFNLKTIKAVQSVGGDDKNYEDWFDALEYMKAEIDKQEYDICLLGCGAYGFPLAAHVKRNGKKAVHWGGSLQLYFGIIGKRWEDPNYAVEVRKDYAKVNYLSLFNESWVRPTKLRTKSYEKVEGGCYW